MRHIILSFSLVMSGMMLKSCVTHPQTSSDIGSGESYRSFTDDGAWCWFSDPRAVYYEGRHRRTYSGWVDSVGNIVVAAYDHDDGKIESFVLHEKFERDDHDNPSFIVDGEGKLMVFYSKHATGNSPIFLARAKTAESISEWEPLQALRLNDTIAYAGFSNTYTYTNVVRLSDEQEKLFLFWRGADFKPNFSVSPDNGRTWEKGKVLILPERIYKDRRPYIKVASDNKSVIHLAFTDGHPHVEPANSIYYMKYRKGALSKANGEKIIDWSDAPVDPAKADVVYDAGKNGAKAWIWDIAEDKSNDPTIVYATFPTDTTHVYHYAVFDNGSWSNYRLTEAGSWFPHTREGVKEREPNYSGGIALDHNDPSVVYLSKERDGVFEIEKWSTDDKGKNWKVTDVTSNSQYDNVRPFVIRNYPDDAPAVLWMNIQKYRHYTDYQSGIRMSVRK